MRKIVLTNEQARQIASAEDGVQFVTEAGDTLCLVEQSAVYASDFTPLTVAEEWALVHRLADPPDTFATTEEVLARLSRLKP